MPKKGNFCYLPYFGDGWNKLYFCGIGAVISPILGLNWIKAKDIKSCTYCCYVKCATLLVWVGGMFWRQKGKSQYHAQLKLPDIGCAIKILVVCNGLDIKPLDLLNSLALGCYQPSPEVLIFIFMNVVIFVMLTYNLIMSLFKEKWSITKRIQSCNFFVFTVFFLFIAPAGGSNPVRQSQTLN